MQMQILWSMFMNELIDWDSLSEICTFRFFVSILKRQSTFQIIIVANLNKLKFHY